MSNYIKMVTSTEIENDYTIYGAVLKKVENDSCVTDLINHSRMFYTYSLETNINYDKSIQAKVSCPELYRETEKMYFDMYCLVTTLLSLNEEVFVYLSLYDRILKCDDVLQVLAIKADDLLKDVFELELDTVYLIRL